MADETSSLADIMYNINPQTRDQAIFQKEIWSAVHDMTGRVAKALEKYTESNDFKSKPSKKRKLSDSDSKSKKPTPPRKKRKLSESTSKKISSSSSKKNKSSTKSKSKTKTKTKTKTSSRSKSPSKNKNKSKPKPKPTAKAKTKRISSSSKSAVGDDEPIYKIRRARSGWVFFNAEKIAEILKKHPDLKLGERTKKSAHSWHLLNDKEKGKWLEKAAREKLKYQTVHKQWKDEGEDFNKIPIEWKVVDKAAMKKRKEKKQKESSKEISSSKTTTTSSPKKIKKKK
eukprot:43502_1